MSITDFRIGAGSLSVDGQDVGLTTEEGIVVNYEPNIHQFTSGKYGKTPVKAALLGVNLNLVVQMAEHTFNNLENAMAGIGRSGARLKVGGIAGREIDGHALVITPFDGTPSWTFRNAVAISSVATAYQVNNERIIAVTFQAMVDLEALEDENVAFVS